jgi:hypothetical protein
MKMFDRINNDPTYSAVVIILVLVIGILIMSTVISQPMADFPSEDIEVESSLKKGEYDHRY